MRRAAQTAKRSKLSPMPKVKNNLQKTRKKFFEDLKNGAAG
jgi:hypothetical protein